MYGGFAARIFHHCVVKLGKIPGYYLRFTPFTHPPSIYSYHPPHLPNLLNKHPASHTDETLNAANPQAVDTGHVLPGCNANNQHAA